VAEMNTFVIWGSVVVVAVCGLSALYDYVLYPWMQRRAEHRAAEAAKQLINRVRRSGAEAQLHLEKTLMGRLR
jgi:hypothetical protein